MGCKDIRLPPYCFDPSTYINDSDINLSLTLIIMIGNHVPVYAVPIRTDYSLYPVVWRLCVACAIDAKTGIGDMLPAHTDCQRCRINSRHAILHEIRKVFSVDADSLVRFPGDD